MSTLDELGRKVAQAARLGVAATRDMTAEERAKLHQMASQLSERQLQTVWDLIDETHPLELDNADEEGSYLDLDLDQLDDYTLWVVHAYVLFVTVFKGIIRESAREGVDE